MSNFNETGTEVDFLDELSQLSAPLVENPAQPPIAYADLPMGSFITIRSDICFKRFDTRFLAGIGDANVSRTLGQIRELTSFRDLCAIVWDNSDTMSVETKKRNFFFGRRQNLQTILEYCILSDLEMKETSGELDESDLMMVEEFHKIFNFYKKEKTISVSDDNMLMDVFCFFVSRDMDLEATILAERAQAIVTERVRVNEDVNVDNEEVKTTDADEVMEDISFTLSEIGFSKAELFYVECQLTNPKDVWNEFAFVDNSNFDFSKITSLLNQKSKNYFLLEKKKEKAMMCFGLMYTEDIAFKNWLNRNPEMLNIKAPVSFQELVNFSGSHDLECFKSMEKEAINHETSVLHISAHMFFERTEVKQKLQSVINEFAFKSGANKKAMKVNTTLNKRREVEGKLYDDSFALGFVEKFVEVMRLRKKLSKVNSEIEAKSWSNSWTFLWGNELYNRSVLYVNPLFENLFKSVMDEQTKKDRIEGSKMIVKSLIAQINALLISMNHDYLTLMNITIFNEVVYKFMDPTSSQFVAVSLVRAGMVYSNKFLWELLIFKKLWSISQENNYRKQKEANEKRKLEQFQKPTEVQLDEKIEDKVNAKIDSTVPHEVHSILARALKPQSFIQHDASKKPSASRTNSNETQKSGMVGDKSKKWKKRRHKKSKLHEPAAINTPTIAITGSNSLDNTPRAQQTMQAISVTQPIQDTPVSVTVPQNPPQPFRNVNRGRGRGRNFTRGFGRRDGRSFGRNNAKNTGENDAYCMDVAPLNIFENQVVPMGLHNFSKIFRPNIATTRVFSLGMKFIPVWKKVHGKKLLMVSTISDVV